MILILKYLSLSPQTWPGNVPTSCQKKCSGFTLKRQLELRPLARQPAAVTPPPSLPLPKVKVSSCTCERSGGLLLSATESRDMLPHCVCWKGTLEGPLSHFRGIHEGPFTAFIQTWKSPPVCERDPTRIVVSSIWYPLFDALTFVMVSSCALNCPGQQSSDSMNPGNQLWSQSLVSSAE